MTITKHPVNGSLECSDIIDNQLVRRTYYGYTRREARQLFREETKTPAVKSGARIRLARCAC